MQNMPGMSCVWKQYIFTRHWSACDGRIDGNPVGFELLHNFLRPVKQYTYSCWLLLVKPVEF